MTRAWARSGAAEARFPTLRRRAIFASPTGRGRTFVLSAALTTTLVSPAARAQEGAKVDLSRPLSPGTIASLVERTKEPGVVDRLAEGLKHPKPEVRAAAARVVNVSAVRVLVPDIRLALAVEPDLGAATEQAWALSALGGAAENEALVSAARRLAGQAPGRFALILARTLGADALPYATLLTEGPTASARWQAFLALAVRADQNALSRVASAILRDGGADAWRALLRVVRNQELTLDSGLLLTALQHPQPRVRGATYWHLASLRADGKPIPEAVPDVLGQTPDAGDPSLAPFDAFGREILGRALGRAAVREGVWLAALRDPKIRSRAWPFPNQQVLTYLTREELKAADLNSKDVPRPRSPRSATPREPVRRSPSGYPAGFVTDVLTATGCEAAPHLPPAMAEVVYGYDGRPRRISVIESLLPPNCAAAGRILILTALPPIDSASRPEESAALILPFQPTLMTCLGTGEQEPSGQYPSDPTVALEEPKVLRNEGFTYPRSARRAGSEGLVEIESRVTSTGCVDGFRIVTGKDPKLYWEVIIAKIEDRYSPMVVGGTPVPTVFTHRVNFMY